jgi:hypothetical protein
MVALPNSQLHGPLFGPIQLAIPAISTLTSNRTQEVPAGAPAGDYSYLGYLGYYPATIFSQDAFPFSKSGDDGSGDWGIGWANTGEAFAVPMAAELPTACRLYPAHPNPFNPSMAISYQLSTSGRVSLKIFDISGRLVATLVDGWREAGVHEVTFVGSALPSGIYIYRITAGSWSSSEKIILLK